MLKKRIIVAITGASGLIYGIRLAQILSSYKDISLHCIISSSAYKVFATEFDTHENELTQLIQNAIFFDNLDIGAPCASGSWKHDGMIICPCSMASLSAVAHGSSSTLIHRSADVTLKERFPLILITRETPLNAIHLQNLQIAQRAGAIIMPASPSFYNNPKTIQDLIDHFVGRILDQLKLPQTLSSEWGQTNA